ASPATRHPPATFAPNVPPATPPAGLANTYTVELSADEAQAAHASTVTFSQPLSLYVENYLKLPVGTQGPHGFYDTALGSWVPAPNGVVLKVISVTNGMANVDVNGDGTADVGGPLEAIGISGDERVQLAALYSDGQARWRT